jgi:predicted NBD/HSP70 family sugar kinase
MGPDDPPLRALARAVRIAHALYRPHHVFLAGGIGIRLKPFVDGLHRQVAHQLTRISRPDATLSAAQSDFHAAQGAARLALQTGRSEPVH